MEDGYKIIQILNEAECDEIKHNMIKTLEFITAEMDDKIISEDIDTYKNISKLLPINSMLIQHWQVGHAQFIWDLRQNPKIIKEFEEIYGTNNLLVSFDGISCKVVPKTQKGERFHCDQKYSDSDFKCIQSWINAVDTNEGDPTLTLLKGSHLLHKEFAEKFGLTKEKSNWRVLKEEEKQWYKDRCETINITCPKGSLVMWDSRTIHYGNLGTNKNSERYVVYLSYQPRKLATESNIKKRIKAFEEKRMTTHWSAAPKLFPLKPRMYPGVVLPKVLPVPSPELNEIGKRLVGYQ